MPETITAMNTFYSIVFITFLAITLTFASCGEKVEQEVVEKEQVDKSEQETPDLAKGFQLMGSSCYSCHSPKSNPKVKIAPTFQEIKLSYLSELETESDFVQTMVSFLEKPSEEHAIMKKAVNEYGLMPNMGFNKSDLSNIAHYIYASALENENWYAEEYPLEKKKYSANPESGSYKELGIAYAMKTKSELGKNLLGAINAYGTEGAVSFCNLKALTITDSMSNQLGIHIRRVSDQARNPLNKANETELAYIRKAKAALKSQQPIYPSIIEHEKDVVGYYPITTNKMCLQCHGNPKKEIAPEVYAKIKSLYPEDLATGYGENQLRGLWVVTMKKNEQ